jgi:hypothetical protein
MLRASPCALASVLVLAGCATAPSAPTEKDGVYTTWAQYGSLAGSWARAEQDAIAQAQQFCTSKGLTYALVKEEKTGAYGWTPQRTTVSFRCEEGFAQMVAPLITECQDQMSSTGLDPIRSKVELYRPVADAPPPFQLAANDSYPTDMERQAIAKWASLRDACIARERAISRVPPSATPLQAAFIEQDASFANEITGKVSALIVALYQGRLTYGEFAQKRYEFGRDGTAAEREFRQATLIQDQQRAMQAEQLAQQNFQNKVAAWSVYLQAVNSRPAQTNVHVEQNVNVH